MCCLYLDLWIVIPLSPNSGEVRMFVLLGLLGCLCDASEQECGCKVRYQVERVHFCLQGYLTEKYINMGMF